MQYGHICHTTKETEPSHAEDTKKNNRSITKRGRHAPHTRMLKLSEFMKIELSRCHVDPVKDCSSASIIRWPVKHIRPHTTIAVNVTPSALHIYKREQTLPHRSPPFDTPTPRLGGIDYVMKQTF